MPRSLVGRVKNEKFAFFWLLIGGSIANFFPIFYSFHTWPLLLPPAILSILVAISMIGKKKRPKVLLAIDLVVSLSLLVLLALTSRTSLGELTLLLPDCMIVLGCVLGLMNW